MDEHYKETISLSELSRQFGMSRATFCAVFPQFTGLSPHKYIAQKRIREAQMLIRSHPERSLAAIGREVGYADEVTFYRNFLRVTGISPAKYRALSAT
jgi:AraC family transcriptional regulator